MELMESHVVTPSIFVKIVVHTGRRLMKRHPKVVVRLVGSLEHILYVNFCNLYLMDCALFFLVLRTFTQLPQSASLVAKSLRRTIFFILGITMIFIVNHHTKTQFRPSVVLDFFGRGHPSRMFLISADLTIAVLQLFRVLIMQSGTAPPSTNTASKTKTLRRKDSLSSPHPESSNGLTRANSGNISYLDKQTIEQRSLNFSPTSETHSSSFPFDTHDAISQALYLHARGPYELPPPFSALQNSYIPNDRLFGSVACLFELEMDDVFVGVPTVYVNLKWPTLLSMPVRMSRRRWRKGAAIRNEDITVDLPQFS